jgi:hypothetical protein
MTPVPRIHLRAEVCMLMTTRPGLLLCWLLAAMSLAGPASADGDAPVLTSHLIRVGGRSIAYSAESGRIPIRDVATGEPLAEMFYVAYRVPARKGEVRPLAFMWNGGPGLPAASVEFEGFGPRRIEQGKLVDNQETVLTDADLVFVDPVGTGFSRAVSPEAQEAFTSIVGDAAAAAEFVRAFVLRHGDEDKPLILSGQSYAAGRAGAATYRLLKRGLKVRGLMLVSNSEGLPRYEGQALIAPAIHVADYAVAALYYHKLPPEYGTTPEAARGLAERWARETYIPALQRLPQLSAEERETIVRTLARRIGLEPGDIDRATLVVTQGSFLGHLVPGQLPYYSDYRILEPHHSPSLDPGVRSLRHELGYPSDLPYLGIEPIEQGFAPSGTYPRSVNALWRHTTVYGATDAQLAASQAEYEKKELIGMGHFGPDLSGAADAIALEPALRVMAMHGAYDPLGGCSIDAELVRHLEGHAREAITAKCYLAGHAIYRDAPARADYARDMRALARAIAGENR